ncbi:hypothetical protein [Candidatus Nitrospira nitrosa]|jgi:hypothetical protein|uniref:hypothetical protein n=1 Tax=Candidatus Nitrospira nitrosa TaxID=1742972 RepID=UPI000AB3074C|nr:hypothetical protein [Candidatus Nitrospira nitrosa]
MEAIEHRDPGAENRRRFRWYQHTRNGRQRLRTCDQVLGISSILMEARDEEFLRPQGSDPLDPPP